VLVESLYMTVYTDLLPARRVLLEQNIESQINKQYSQLKVYPSFPNAQTGERRELPQLWDATWRMMELYENRIWQKYPLRVTVSADDRQEMDRRCDVGRSIVVENGVGIASHPLLPQSANKAILFTGRLDYFPNLDAAFYLVREIMPRIWREDPGISLYIAGSYPPPELEALAAPPGVCMVVNPVDMQSAARQASLAVVPLRMGGGTRLKILEALAWGLPVVSTALGCRGLAVTEGQDILIRDDPSEFAATVVQLLSNAEQRAALRVNGRALVEARYDWEPIWEYFGKELEKFAGCETKH
jgi:glycosyltransferase involved in cell wall biosynthesis